MNKVPTLGYSVLALGFERDDIDDWRRGGQLAVHRVATGALSDAVVHGAGVDVVLIDLVGHDEIPDPVRRLRSAAPSVGIVLIVEPALEGAALAHGAHEVLTGIHGGGDLDLALRRAVTRAQVDLRSAPMTMDSVFGRVPAPMFRTLLSGEIIQANAPLAELLGVGEAEQLAGMDAGWFYVDPGARQRFMDRLQRTGRVERTEVRLRRLDGRTVWVAVMAYLVEDGFGRPLYIEGLVLDVSDLMRERRRSSTAEQVHEWMFRHSPIPLWELDYSRVASAIAGIGGIEALEDRLRADPLAVYELSHGVVLRYVNRAALDLIGATDEGELLDLASAPFVTSDSDDLAIAHLRTIASGDNQLIMEVAGRDPAGRPLDVKVLWMAGDFADLPPYSRVVVAVMDETAAQQHRRGLERMVETKDAFISSVAHHLRTPLTAILGFGAELHDQGTRFTDSETKGMLGDLVAAARAATNIVEDMAVAARNELDTLVFRSEAVDVGVIAVDVLDALAPDASVVGSAPPACADGARTRQIIRALVSNAVEYGGPSVSLVLSYDERRVEVDVVDDGPGVPADQREKMFDAYVSGRGGATNPSPIGLGLHVARRLARRMGGELAYVRDERTTFRLSLPRRD